MMGGTNMPTFDDLFVATGIPDFDWVPGLPGFSTEDDDQGNPRFVVGGQIKGTFVGVWGQGGGGEDDFPFSQGKMVGVVGSSPQGGVGVFGQSEATSTAPATLTAGVIGTADNSSGVIGWSTSWHAIEGWASQGIGVLGVSVFERGVGGASTWQPGVLGWSENDVGVMGGSGQEGTQGPTVPNTSNIAGIVGTSDQQHGVIGTSNKSVGVIGFSNNIGVFGYTTTPGANAGYFLGNVDVTGDVSITGNLTVKGQFNQKGCAVPFPDGTYRTLYCMESPEVWFEDFGAARLKGGRAVVKVDTDFAKVIKRGDYRVFLTPEGDCRGLYVRSKRAAAFEVRELMGGKSAIAFSYRIVGRRKDVRGSPRFAKTEFRPIPIPKGVARKPARTRAAVRTAIARLQKAAQDGRKARSRRARG
jgi:hypothetical protein